MPRSRLQNARARASGASGCPARSIRARSGAFITAMADWLRSAACSQRGDAGFGRGDQRPRLGQLRRQRRDLVAQPHAVPREVGREQQRGGRDQPPGPAHPRCGGLVVPDHGLRRRKHRSGRDRRWRHGGWRACDGRQDPGSHGRARRVVACRMRQGDGDGAARTGIDLALGALGQMRLDLAGLGLRQGAQRPGIERGSELVVRHWQLDSSILRDSAGARFPGAPAARPGRLCHGLVAPSDIRLASSR